MKYSNDIILSKAAAGEKMKFIFFWGHTPGRAGSVDMSCLSQWYECRFTVDSVVYHTAEQYMMSQKALLFGDEDIYQKIMNAGDPGAYKALGRMISGFDEELWKSRRTDIVINGNMAKFSQNDDLREFLLNTGSRVLVEASPYDRIWGIGMAKNSADIEDPFCWKGTNLLGYCLMEVRDRLKEELNAR
ncbi:MAG: NADAR family protein [Ruminococcus sp.]|nr:NADAR family protein [Ruminococcus sp.]